MKIFNKNTPLAENHKIFFLQLRLLRLAANLLETRIQQIDLVGKSLDEDKNIKANVKEAKIIVALFQKLSIQFYKKILLFLVNEIEKDNKGVHVFLLPHIRTLLDIYSRFLHLLENCNNESERAAVCLALQLKVSKAINDTRGYKKIMELNKYFLESIKINFPKDPPGLTNKWIKNHKLNFDTTSNLLTEKLIKKYSAKARNVFGAEQTYKIYSHFSEMMHGNPYYFNDESNNAIFWIISSVTINVSYFIEIIDTNILHKNNPRDYRDWLNEVINSKPEFIDEWERNRLVLNEKK